MMVAGFGCRAGASLAALQAALQAAQARLSQPVILRALAAPADRAAQLAPLAAALRLPLIVVEPAMLARQRTPTVSVRCLVSRGCGSVAEAVALSAAGPGARLLVSRQISPDRSATCAIAQGDPA